MYFDTATEVKPKECVKVRKTKILHKCTCIAVFGLGILNLLNIDVDVAVVVVSVHNFSDPKRLFTAKQKPTLCSPTC